MQNNMQSNTGIVCFVGVFSCAVWREIVERIICWRIVFPKIRQKPRISPYENSKNHSCTYAVQSSKQSQFTPTYALIYRFNITIFVNCWCWRSHCALVLHCRVLGDFDFCYPLLCSLVFSGFCRLPITQCSVYLSLCVYVRCVQYNDFMLMVFDVGVKGASGEDLTKTFHLHASLQLQ